MVSVILILTTTIFFPGLIFRFRSILSGRKGPGIVQPWKDIFLLLRKSSVFSTTSSYILQAAPTISLSCVLSSIVLIPCGNYEALTSFEGDFILFSFLLAMSRFFMILNALDTGSSFEGMGANREVLYNLLLEPALFFIVGTLSYTTGYTSFTKIFSYFHLTDINNWITALVSTYLLIQIIMIENSRMPVDDSRTHLELTMIHEVMILDNSGWDLALIKISTHLKFAIYGLIISNFYINLSENIFVKTFIFISIQLIFITMAAVFESFRARNKMSRNPQFIITLSAIGFLAFVLSIITKL